jgi:hypothetical protein
MSELAQLYKLQRIDLKIQENKRALNEILHELMEPEVLVVARTDIEKQKQLLLETRKKRKEQDWKEKELKEKAGKLGEELYSGRVKNSRELANLEQELKSVKARLKVEEDELLELMEREEELEGQEEAASQQLKAMELDWKQKKEGFLERKQEIENSTGSLVKERRSQASAINPQIFKLYEEIRERKGQAVATMTQGQCQGCRILLSTREQQQVKGGKLVQCSSCGRILFSE